MKTFADTTTLPSIDPVHAQLRAAVRQATEDEQAARRALHEAERVIRQRRLLSQPDRLARVQRDLTDARAALADAVERRAMANREMHANIRSQVVRSGGKQRSVKADDDVTRSLMEPAGDDLPLRTPAAPGRA